MASATSTSTSKSVTTALYAEFTRETKTYQLIVVPETTDYLTDEKRPMVSMYRQITQAHPRRPWTTNLSPVTTVDTELLSTEDTAKQALTMLDRTFDLLESLRRGSWELVKFPTAIEVSAEDLEALHEEGKTPTALIRRVLRARATAGYGTMAALDSTPAKAAAAPAAAF